MDVICRILLLFFSSNFIEKVKELKLNNFFFFSLLIQTWPDYKLKWNPSNYGNLTKFIATQHEIWLPDITLYNSATIASAFNQHENMQVVVYNDGTILWVPQFKFDVFCSLNLRLWPFDTQKCSLIFGSWVYSGYEIYTSLKMEKNIPATKIERFVENHEWIIKNVSSEVQVKIYQCCEEPYVSVSYNLTLERRSPMYSAVVVTPATSIILIILSVFWLPPESSEKIILNGFNFLTLMMFIIFFTFKLPVFAFHTPLIGIFFLFCLHLKKKKKLNGNLISKRVST